MGCLLPFPRPDPSINPSIKVVSTMHDMVPFFLPSLAGWLGATRSPWHGLPLLSIFSLASHHDGSRMRYKEENSFVGQRAERTGRRTYVRHSASGASFCQLPPFGQRNGTAQRSFASAKLKNTSAIIFSGATQSDWTVRGYANLD
jgi:hypothetical protein